MTADRGDRGSRRIEDRCRLVLVVPPMAVDAALLRQALEGGDVASVILARGGLGDEEYQERAGVLAPVAQQAGAAALVCDDTRALGRCGADGILFETPGNDPKELVKRYTPGKIVGFGGARDRDRALVLGEAQPDFLFFGKTDGDTRPQPHPRNLELGEWWAQMISLPCIVGGGSAVESIVDCAATGAEFAALSLAVFSHVGGPREAVARANALLDEHAPVLESAG
jgi:thiamine-phosphate pyrophosphorylase